ncbi:MAG: carbamoyltransferase HypF [Opitutae bacterium]|nr:carbamoyltransferase HypF [Opitutae bacterium]
MPPPLPATDVMLRVRGTVQGVGFRPFVHRTASKLGVHGWVLNDPQGVLIRAAGDTLQIDALVSALEHEAPPAAHVIEVRRLAPQPVDQPVGGDFVILSSKLRGSAVTAATPADLALCADCRRELLDPHDRRFHYPFINCTQCGPRYSIIDSLPYDRPRTTMRAFRMCPECKREYENPSSRRFHAEPNACPVCGPQLRLTESAGNIFGRREDAIRLAATALHDGLILAVKGVGGYHLMCDATNERVVTELRHRKHREEKPLAVMFRDLEMLQEYADASPAAEKLLLSPQAPIVLLPQRPGRPLAYSIAPGNPWVGALLPYAPLHVLLLAEFDRPVVATSANLSEEPLCTDNDEARERLFAIADLYLEHDRIIARPVDDSLVRLAADNHPIILRRARGYAPAPLDLPGRLPGSVLCLGGQMKNTIAVASGEQLVLSPHIGDLENLSTHQVFERTIKMLGELYESRFALIAHDKHPGYTSTQSAIRSGLPRLAVQHHLAHVLACLLENHHPAEGVLGISWDGTGYGEDGTVWGGEFLLLGQGRAERFARLRPFRLVGGEAAVKDARRVALALAHEFGQFTKVAARFGLSPHDTANLNTMLTHSLNSPVCSSAGRLFDGVGALLRLGVRNTFEGQMPIAVEAAATRAARSTDVLPFEVKAAVTPGAILDVDWQPTIERLLHAEGDPDVLAAAFHRGLAQAMVDVARQAGAGTVALTGGCFQNALLHTLASEALTAAGFKVLVHRELSPNDNSIAAGQALAALWNLTTVTLPS